MNIFETVTNLLRGVVQEETPAPLHVGEVMAAWTYMAMSDEAVSYLEAAMNMTEDEELLQMLHDCKNNCDSQITRLSQFMLKEGIPKPPGPEAKPDSSPSAVPPGVKLTNDEIANGIAAKTAATIMTAASGITTAVRNDVGLMWSTFQVEKMALGSKLKSLMIRRDWLKVPPPYHPPGRPGDR